MEADVNCMKLGSKSFTIVSVGTGGHVHRNYTLAKTVYMKQEDAIHYPTCSQYWTLQAAKRAHSQLDANIGFARHKFFGFQRQFFKTKDSPGFCRIILNAVSSGGLDVQDSDWGKEETRWQREEKRWLREEERWLREEARWNTDRKALVEKCASLVDEINILKNEISQLQSEVKGGKHSIPDLINGLTSLLHSLNAASALRTDDLKVSTPALVVNAASSATNVSGALSEISPASPITNFRVSLPVDVGIESTSILGSTGIHQPEKTEGFVKMLSSTSKAFTETRHSFKRGSEGDDVKLIQDALAKLGFYSGEEDIKYSTFANGTDRAVRAWQATLGIAEDGILTKDLLAKLFGEETPNFSGQGKATGGPVSSSRPSEARAGSTGKSTASVGMKEQGSKSTGAKEGASVPDFKAQASEPPGSNVQNSMSETFKSSYSSKEVSQKRVYLLGENRWEEPDRLLSKNGPTPVATVVGLKCFSCKGQGTMLCTECEGTGELNVEEQFLEWAEEGAKCPYCEGAGTIYCDVCNGKGEQNLS